MWFEPKDGKTCHNTQQKLLVESEIDEEDVTVAKTKFKLII